ncbi:hypothetical protein B296_00007212 [Ensete ventricosum]|uniref:Uncharacterized protein n=1 Tax=Ensete ventricosum TaxID=4639 RepID=A0A426YL21_ENSVE|nr:hypothetical protein B296_00007212 [Ensete ventricosum]
MMTDPGFHSPASNPALFLITTETFLGLTNHVQALAGMVQTIVSYLPQLIQSVTHQSAPPTVFSQTEWPVAPIGRPRLRRSRHNAKSRKLVQPPRLSRQLGREVALAIRNFRSPSIPSHAGILDKTETIEVLLVTDRATARNATRDAATSASIHGHRDVGGKQAGRDEAAPRTPPAATEEEGGQATNPVKSHSERHNKRRYCPFHREYNHDTEECCDLQYQIEDLIRRGHLRRYVRDQSSLPDSRPPRDSSPRPKGPIEKQIDVIFGGPTSGDDSSSARKAYA